MASDVDVQFGANVDGIDKGTDQVRQKLQDLSGHVSTLQGGFDSMSSSMESSLGNISTGLGSLESSFKSLNDSIEKGGSTLSVEWLKGLGAIGVAAAAALAVFHNISEGFIKVEQSAREANISLARFQELQYALNQSGVGTDKLISGLGEASKKLNDLSHDSGELGKFLDENNVKWKDAQGHIIDMNQYLDIAVRLISNAATQGDRFKAGELLGFSKEWVRTLQQGPVAMQMLTEEAHKTGAVISDELIRKNIEFEKEWDRASAAWAQFFKQKIVELTPVIMDLINWLGRAISYVTGVATNLAAAIKDDFKDAFAPSSTFKPLVDSVAVMPGTLSATYDSMSKFFDVTQQTRVNWDGIVKDATALNKDVLRSLTESFPGGGSATKFPGKDEGGDDTHAQLQKINEQIDAWRQYYEKLKIYEKNAVDTFKETESQKVANLLAALNQREAAIKELYQKELNVVGDDANKQADIRRRMNKEIEAIDKERMQLEAENLKKSLQEWESTINSITGAFNSQLRGLLAGTTTWAQAMRNIAANLVIKMIEEFEKLAIVKPLSSMLASSLSAPTELFSGLVKAVSGMFGPLSAGFTSFFAPTLGPAAPAAGAAAAAAEVAASTAAVGSFEFGTDYVPRTGLAMIHQGERIIPASQNAAGGFSPQAMFSFNVSAIDANGVQGFLTRFAPQFAKVMAAHMAQNPSFGR